MHVQPITQAAKSVNVASAALAASGTLYTANSACKKATLKVYAGGATAAGTLVLKINTLSVVVFPLTTGLNIPETGGVWASDPLGLVLVAVLLLAPSDIVTYTATASINAAINALEEY